jgi:hypothetical protein
MVPVQETEKQEGKEDSLATGEPTQHARKEQETGPVALDSNKAQAEKADEPSVLPKNDKENPSGPSYEPPVSVMSGHYRKESKAAQQEQQRRKIRLHMVLLQHTATCRLSSNCPSQNCKKMRTTLMHGIQCKIKASGGCSTCKRIWNLLQIHASQCKVPQCPVPNCVAIRKRAVDQLKKQQVQNATKEQPRSGSIVAVGSNKNAVPKQALTGRPGEPAVTQKSGDENLGPSQQNEKTEAQRRECQRSVQQHVTLLLHTVKCKSSKCPSTNCNKMKSLLKHGHLCQVKAIGGCSICKKIWALLQIHAGQCKTLRCPVPNCTAIRRRSIELRMTLLLHTVKCKSPKCPSANCYKMKALLKHAHLCQAKAIGGCSICKKVWALLQIHASQCKTPWCPVPNCTASRERVRQLKERKQTRPMKKGSK